MDREMAQATSNQARPWVCEKHNNRTTHGLFAPFSPRLLHYYVLILGPVLNARVNSFSFAGTTEVLSEHVCLPLTLHNPRFARLIILRIAFSGAVVI